jgi:diguanylate cyclase (GGDEF)-like protein
LKDGILIFFCRSDAGEPGPGHSNDPESGKSPGGRLDFDTVMKVSQAISSEIVLDRLLEIIMEISITNAGAQKGFLILETDEKLMVEAGIDPDRNISRIEKPIPLQDCPGLSGAIVNYVFRTMEPVILANASDTGPFKNDVHVMANNCKSILCMPILNKSRITGILYMENNLGTNAFTRKRLALLGIIAGQAAISLENARLFEMATTDGLTRLFVHRYFQFLLEQEMNRSRRYGRPCSLLMIDIDNFKHLNDTYGHQAGDEVLKKLAQTLVRNTRGVDVCARYGGEEFVIILPETSIEDAMIVGEKIIRAIEKIKIHHGDHTLKITASIGAATFPDHAANKTELIRLADNALYLSKKMGKNRISQCTSDNPTTDITSKHKKKSL